MTKDELRERLRHATTPNERRGLLEEYRLRIARTTTARQRYRQMDRFIRTIRRVGK
jgi:hypothetical protein